MFNVEDILARLNKGESIESIAAEMTEVLNEANDAYAAAKETEDRKAALTAAADNLISSLLEYVALVYPEAVEDITNDDIAELTSLLVNEADALKDVAAMCAAFGDMKVGFFCNPSITPTSGCKDGCACQTGRPHELKQAPKEAEKAAEDIIAEFLKKNFLS
jgi:hypothetical protein